MSTLSSSLTSAAQPTAVVAPGGAFQVQLIQKIQQRGVRVVCADRSTDCPGGHVADAFVPVGLDQPDALLEKLRPFEPVAVVTDQTDSGVRTVAWLCEQLGLPGIGTESAELFTDKSQMRAFSRRHGFAVPDFRVVRSVDESLAAAEALGYPVVLKPVAGQSSRGVYRIDDDRAMSERFAQTQGVSGRAECLVEEFLDGTEFTVEGFKGAGGHRSLAISEKHHYAHSPMVADSLTFTPSHRQFDYARLARLNDAWVDAAGLPFGITHAEYIFTKGQFFLVEIAARGGGTRIASDIVSWVSGLDAQELLFEAACGRPRDLTGWTSAQRCALLEFFDIPSGTVQRVTGIEEARRYPGVLDLTMKLVPGQVVAAVRDDTTRPGYFILATNTPAELAALRTRVLSTVEVHCA